jgi:hypothetical protein
VSPWYVYHCGLVWTDNFGGEGIQVINYFNVLLHLSESSGQMMDCETFCRTPTSSTTSQQRISGKWPGIRFYYTETENVPYVLPTPFSSVIKGPTTTPPPLGVITMKLEEYLFLMWRSQVSICCSCQVSTGEEEETRENYVTRRFTGTKVRASLVQK